MRRWRRWRATLARSAGMVLAVTLVLGNLAVPPAQADIVGDGEMASLRAKLFGSYMRAHDPGLQGLKDMVLSAELMSWRQANPGATEAQIRDHLVYMQQATDARLKADDWQRTSYEYVIKLLEAISGIPQAAPYIPAVKAILEMSVGKELLEWGGIQDRIHGASQISRWQDDLFATQDWVWGDVARLGEADQAFASAWSAVIGVRAGTRADATLEQLMADPLIGTYINVEAILAHQQDQGAYLAEVRRQLQTVFAALLDNTQAINKLGDASTARPVSVASTPDPKALARAKAEAEARQEVINAAGAAVSILSTLVGFADPKFGKQIATIGKAAVTIGTAINQYLTKVEGLKLGEALTSLSTVVLTGNILAAVMTLLPLFAASEPSPEQMILEQIVELRKDVRELATQMNNRFDRIEKALVTMYGDMLQQFDRLQGDITVIRGNLTDIQTRLLSIENKVDTFGGKLVDVASALSLQDQHYMMSKYLDYEEEYGEPIPSYNGGGDQYTDPENVFYSTAVNNSRNGIFTVSSGLFATADPVAELDKHRAIGAINYLAWLARRYDSAFPQPASVVPNPLVWGLGARSYSALAIDYPGYASRAGSAKAQEIARAGDEIQAAVQTFSQPRSTPDAAGNRTNFLFVNLMESYRAAARQFATAVEAVRRNTAQEGKTYELFGTGAQQVPAAAIPAEPTNPCSAVATPSNVKLRDLPAEVLFATYVQPSKPELRITCSYAFENVQEDANQYREWATADLRLSFHLQYRTDSTASWSTVRSISRAWSAGTISECKLDSHGVPYDCYYRTALQKLQQTWTTQKPNFEAYATWSTNQALVDGIRTGNVAYLQGRQGYLYHLVKNMIERKEGAVGDAAGQVHETGRLLQAYTELGFSRAVEQDDLLSALLYGSKNLPMIPELVGTYVTAANNYAGCSNASSGGACPIGFSPQPMANHRHLEASCDVSGVTGLPIDPVSQCLVASALKRTDEFAVRIETHSRRLASNIYTEGLASVAETTTNVRAVDTIIRAGWVKDSGFEPSWTYTGGAAQTASMARTGSGALHLPTTSAAAEQTVNGLTPNTTYQLSGWARVDVPGEAVAIGVRDHGAAEAAITLTGSAYGEATFRFTTGASATSATIFCRKTAGNGAANCDDITLTPGGLRNGGFEQYWSLSGGATIVTGTTAHTGSGMLQVPVGGSAQQTVENLSVRTTYELSGFAKTLTSSYWGTDVIIGVRDFGGAEKTIRIYSNSVFKGGQLQFTTGDTARSATIFCRKVNGSPGEPGVCDDITLRPVSQPAPNVATVCALGQASVSGWNKYEACHGTLTGTSTADVPYAGTTDQNRWLQATTVSGPGDTCYSAHIAGGNWTGELCNGQVLDAGAGWFEEVKITSSKASICYQAYLDHWLGSAWQNFYACDGAIAGAKDRRIKALRVFLVGTTPGTPRTVPVTG
ncbi:hypothetical protein AB0L34_13140 [Micromonospora sp. NPDC052213]|uniref:hypothetical protein n=1 Tax=Micromonospora sp. NPDC052213 TaxID=3155812 RepID=UPI00342508D7